MISDEERILDIIKPTIEYDILIASSTTLRARTEMTMKGLDSNLTTILKNRTLNSELSDILEDFESMVVNNNNNIKESQLKKRKRNKYYYTKNTIYGF